MNNVYEPEIEEEDDGYSIPKILVAVLLLLLIGVGIYTVIQSKTIKSKIQTIETQKKTIEKELEEMALKYNLAIDDNGLLSTELKAERDRILRVSDSIKRLKGTEVNIDEYNKLLKSLKDNSSIDFSDKKESKVVENKQVQEVASQDNKTVSIPATTTTQQVTPSDTKKEVVAEQPKTETTVASTNVGPQSFERVEVPATYPGCTGDVTQKKACFNANVKKLLASKFDPNLPGELNLPSGNQRVNVSFTVDKFGNVGNIKAKGPHPKMEAEAIKAAKSLPKMTPARQNGAPVDMTFTVPITLVVE